AEPGFAVVLLPVLPRRGTDHRGRTRTNAGYRLRHRPGRRGAGRDGATAGELRGRRPLAGQRRAGDSSPRRPAVPPGPRWCRGLAPATLALTDVTILSTPAAAARCAPCTSHVHSARFGGSRGRGTADRVGRLPGGHPRGLAWFMHWPPLAPCC